jgi:hypothetical protein
MSIPPNPKRELTDYDQALWDWSVKEIEYVITQFGVAIIGIGALLFAYGELEAAGVHKGLKIFLSAVGLSASLIVWLHSWGARKTSQEVREQIADKEFLVIVRKANAWRHKGAYAYLYYPVSRLIGYFAGLIAVGWGLLLISVYEDWSFKMLWPYGATAILAVAVYALIKQASEVRYWRRKEREDIASRPKLG